MSAYANAYFLSFVVKQKQIKVKLVLPAGVSKLYLSNISAALESDTNLEYQTQNMFFTV